MSDTATEVKAETIENIEATTAPAVKPVKSGDLIFDTATEISGLSKTKALNLAVKLNEDIDANAFRLGGVLHLIHSNQWFEGFPSFHDFVSAKFGFGKRKAEYLIRIYTSLVENQIPWALVGHLGWTKLKDLAPLLTQATVQEWVAKASELTVVELQAAIKASQGGTDEGKSPATTKATSDVVKMTFSLHSDQSEAVSAALAKAKAELSTDHDNVALAGICTGYLANASGAGTTGSVDPMALFKEMGFVAVLEVFEKVFPDIELNVGVPDSTAAAAG